MKPGALEMADVGLGDSITHAGVCLTVVEKNAEGHCVDVSPETLACQNTLPARDR
ncbi:MAG: hypothetical protein LBO79_02465 [Zoogloeaceae bacterium]|nr:hypothetical protein [Zoogloeaceae bacterium]